MSVLGPLHALINAIATGDEDGVPFINLRQEVQAFAQALTGGEEFVRASVSAYLLDVPNHLQACMDLDFQRFSADTPLVHGAGVLRLRHILEAFSCTSPQRYADVWLPVLDLALAVSGPNVHDALHKARNHVLSAKKESKCSEVTSDVFRGVADPGQALDGVMNNILSAFPGLQDMVQKMMVAGSSPDGVPAVMEQVQSILYPLLAQATNDDPSAPNLQPAVAQILEGFSKLTGSLATPGHANPNPPDSGMDE